MRVLRSVVETLVLPVLDASAGVLPELARQTLLLIAQLIETLTMQIRRIETELRDAIQNDVLRPHYQPLIDLSSGRITAFEALVRWPHPERGKPGSSTDWAA